MEFITTVLKEGESWSGPRIEANSWRDAEIEIANLDCCQLTGVLDSVSDQLPL